MIEPIQKETKAKVITGREILVALSMIICGLALSFYPKLNDSLWWYPDSGYMEPWIVWCGLLTAADAWLRSRFRKAKTPLKVAWVATIVFACAGYFNLVRYIMGHLTTGDLFMNHFFGAQRAAYGLPVYDLSGLQQSVNASPFVIAMLQPFGHLGNSIFLPYWLAMSGAAFLVYLFYGWSLLVLFMRRNGRRPGLVELGVLVLTTIFFDSFQRSSRLGQLDVWIMALVLAGIAHLCLSGLEGRFCRWHARMAGLFFALAVGVKIIPAYVAAPIFFWLLFNRKTAAKTLKLDIFVGGLAGVAIVAAVALLGIGFHETGRFFQNAMEMSLGSGAGVNYALVGRFEKYFHPELRFEHVSLSQSTLIWLWPLRLASLASIALLARRTSFEKLPVLIAFSLASIPLVSQLCWDIYYNWAANTPWFIAFSAFTASGGQGDQSRDSALKRYLFGAYLFAVFWFLGLAGTGVYRDVVTKQVTVLDVPMWFDEAKLLGLFLLLAALLFLLENKLPAARARQEQRVEKRLLSGKKSSG
jgi:hypothetical protein